MNNSLNCSNESSDYEANSDTLDKLYAEQLQALRDIVLKRNQTKDIDLCHKWVKVFGKTSKAEKVARNCLCTLMQHQLEEVGHLNEPFTDLQNCNRNLESVLHELDNQTYTSDKNESIATSYVSHCNLSKNCQKVTEHRENPSEPVNKNFNTNEYMDNKTLTENVYLRRELHSLRLHLTEKQIENVKLKEIAAKYEYENDKTIANFNNLKAHFLKDIETFLNRLKTDREIFPLLIFHHIFQEFSSDLEFFNTIRGYDEVFQQIFKSKLEKKYKIKKYSIARQIARKFKKSKLKMQERYKRRLRIQGWAHSLQLKLVKLKCFSVLRQLFINNENNGKEGILDALKILEEKYQSVVNEI